MFFALQVDRKNLNQAVSANMLNQLNLSTNGMLLNLSQPIYMIANILKSSTLVSFVIFELRTFLEVHASTGNTILLVSFLLAELPSQLVSKKLGPDRWIPAQMVIWSIVAAAQCALINKSTFYATRSLLGLLQVSYTP